MLLRSCDFPTKFLGNPWGNTPRRFSGKSSDYCQELIYRTSPRLRPIYSIFILFLVGFCPKNEETKKNKTFSFQKLRKASWGGVSLREGHRRFWNLKKLSSLRNLSIVSIAKKTQRRLNKSKIKLIIMFFIPLLMFTYINNCLLWNFSYNIQFLSLYQHLITHFDVEIIFLVLLNKLW